MKIFTGLLIILASACLVQSQFYFEVEKLTPEDLVKLFQIADKDLNKFLNAQEAARAIEEAITLIFTKSGYEHDKVMINKITEHLVRQLEKRDYDFEAFQTIFNSLPERVRKIRHHMFDKLLEAYGFKVRELYQDLRSFIWQEPSRFGLSGKAYMAMFEDIDHPGAQKTIEDIKEILGHNEVRREPAKPQQPPTQQPQVQQPQAQQPQAQPQHNAQQPHPQQATQQTYQQQQPQGQPQGQGQPQQAQQQAQAQYTQQQAQQAQYQQQQQQQQQQQHQAQQQAYQQQAYQQQQHQAQQQVPQQHPQPTNPQQHVPTQHAPPHQAPQQHAPHHQGAQLQQENLNRQI